MAFLGMRPHLARPLICFTVKGGLIDREQWSNYAEYTVTIKKLCDGFDISLSEFFTTPEFEELEQEIK